MIFIAEVGNNHQGDLNSAKEHIQAARDSGADLVKLQAFSAKDIQGSMPKGFYEKCQFALEEYKELIRYGDHIGIPVFYSIFSTAYRELWGFQKYHKWSASQVKDDYKEIERSDSTNVFVSVPVGATRPHLRYSKIMHVSDYLVTNPGLCQIEELREYYGRPIGYSDHTIGVRWAIEAAMEYGANVIEKHFTLTRDIKFEGKQFRDAVHAASPKEFETMVMEIRGVQ